MTLDFIERMAPGPELTAAIAAMEREGFTDYDRVVALKAYTRLVSHFQAKAYEQMAAITKLISEWDGDPRRISVGRLRLATPPASSPAAACQPPTATSTIASPGPKADPPTDHLEPLCRHDHVIRHKGWKHQHLPGGDHLWTSRLGHHYTTSGRSP